MKTASISQEVLDGLGLALDKYDLICRPRTTLFFGTTDFRSAYNASPSSDLFVKYAFY
jgi:hypothetical protein